jgi:hypothetical protein
MSNVSRELTILPYLLSRRDTVVGETISEGKFKHSDRV